LVVRVERIDGPHRIEVSSRFDATFERGSLPGALWAPTPEPTARSANDANALITDVLTGVTMRARHQRTVLVDGPVAVASLTGERLPDVPIALGAGPAPELDGVLRQEDLAPEASDAAAEVLGRLRPSLAALGFAVPDAPRPGIGERAVRGGGQRVSLGLEG
jgi:hypothetical protein